MIKSQQIYSPQNYVMAMTGECYIFQHDCDIIDEIHKCLVKHGVEDENNTIWDYPFIEIEHIVEEEPEMSTRTTSSSSSTMCSISIKG